MHVRSHRQQQEEQVAGVVSEHGKIWVAGPKGEARWPRKVGAHCGATPFGTQAPPPTLVLKLIPGIHSFSCGA